MVHRLVEHKSSFLSPYLSDILEYVSFKIFIFSLSWNGASISLLFVVEFVSDSFYLGKKWLFNNLIPVTSASQHYLFVTRLIILYEFLDFYIYFRFVSSHHWIPLTYKILYNV